MSDSPGMQTGEDWTALKYLAADGDVSKVSVLNKMKLMDVIKWAGTKIRQQIREKERMDEITSNKKRFRKFGKNVGLAERISSITGWAVNKQKVNK